MLAELAAANAAFAVIKGALANGKELSALGSRVVRLLRQQGDHPRKSHQKGRRLRHGRIHGAGAA
jgi:hypothetical protein